MRPEGPWSRCPSNGGGGLLQNIHILSRAGVVIAGLLCLLPPGLPSKIKKYKNNGKSQKERDKEMDTGKEEGKKRGTKRDEGKRKEKYSLELARPTLYLCFAALPFLPPRACRYHMSNPAVP